HIAVNGQRGWWLSQLDGQFVVAVFCNARLPEDGIQDALAQLQAQEPGLKVVLVLAPGLSRRPPAGMDWVEDHQMTLARRYDAIDGACYLIRPDQHVAARWRHIDVPRIAAALRRASGQESA